MPGATRLRGSLLENAALSGNASRTAIRDSAKRVLSLVDRVKVSEDPISDHEQAIDRPEHRDLIREAGGQGIVLLKNKGILPLDRDQIKSIAVLGPNASVAQIMGGGSSQINAHYRISPLDGIGPDQLTIDSVVARVQKESI